MATENTIKKSASLKIFCYGLMIVGCIIFCYKMFKGWEKRVHERVAAAEYLESIHPVANRVTPAQPLKLANKEVLTPNWVGMAIPPGYRLNTWPKDENLTYAVRVNKDDHRVTVIVPGRPTEGLGDDVTYLEWIDPDTTDANASPKEIYWRLTKK